MPADSHERPARTKKFQAVNDAYFTLSDAARRREYDSARKHYSTFSPDPSFDDDDDPAEEIPRRDTPPPPPGGFPFFGFGSSTRAGGAHAPDAQFGGIFEEMLREEGLAEDDPDGTPRAVPTSRFWGIIGGVSGGALGFIMANVPGALAGAVAGNRLGAVRDAKGKSVYSVFSELPQADKAKLLGELATKVFAHAVGSG